MEDSKEIIVLRQTFTNLCRMFTTHHDILTVEMNQAGKMVTLSPRAHAEDSSKIIGNGGAMFRSLRDVMRVVAHRQGVDFYLARIKDVRGTTKPLAQEPPRERANWPQIDIMRLFNDVGARLFVRPFEAEWSHQSDKSIICLTIAQEEELCLPEVMLEEGLSIVFCSIGKTNGRTVHVELERTNQPKEDRELSHHSSCS